jgi:hypothetical protein
MSKSALAAIADIWNMMSEYVTPDDKTQLADSMVTLLMEYDFDLEDIRHEFDGDRDVLDAVKFYSEDTSENLDDYDDNYEELGFGDEEDYDE